jgi:hypothetical protein
MAVHQPEESRELARVCGNEQTSQLIDWFAEGQDLAVEVAGAVVTVRYVGRKGRRARIAISGPTGVVFRSLRPSEPLVSSHAQGNQHS